MNRKDLKDFLDQKVIEYNRPEFVATDPIQIVHQFSKKQDIEIIGLLVATIAWGNRTSIIKNGQRIVEIMEHSPHDFLMNTDEKDWQHIQFVHRTFNVDDLLFFMKALKEIYTKTDSLESLFLPNENLFGAKSRIHHFRTEFLSHTHLKRNEKHISDPMSGSAAKRLNMYLRWMVRNDNNGIDFGIWKNIPLSELRIPLDVHTGNVARKLGILTRKQNDWKALEEIHSQLDRFDPIDPAKYDFALFGLGVFEGWGCD